MSASPDQEWWTVAEIAARGLPDLPGTKRGVALWVQRGGYDSHPKLSRRRAGRGGGREYHWSLLPVRAQQALLAHVALPAPVEVDRPDRDEAWTVFEGLPEASKEKARARLAVIQAVEALEAGGATRVLAVADAARHHGCSERSVFNWLSLVDGVRPDDRLAYLPPQHRSGKRQPRRAEVDPRFGDLVLGDYLRLSGPSLASVHRRAVTVAETQNIPVAPIHTVRRWVGRTVSPTALTLARKGFDALKRMQPTRERDKAALHAMEVVNGDFHRFDVFVRFPAGADGQRSEIGRVQMCAFQDVHSGKILAWRYDRTPNSHCVQLTLGDMIERYGIPNKVLLDNGREFAAKLITGGSRTRFRFKVKEDDPSGLLTSLGCDILWATPYSGQSKPIERAFRDMCDDIAKHPAFDGAYTGNSPSAKPEDYGSRAIDFELFKAVADVCIAEHNARPDRRSQVAYGRSFDDVFAESYAVAPIRKATEAQRRLWLMGAEGIRADRTSGQISFMRNRYWAAWMSEIRGQRVVVRFDRQALWNGLEIYTAQDQYLGHAPCLQKTGFYDMEDARSVARAQSAWKKAARAELDAARRLTAAQVADALSDVPVAAPRERPEATVVRPLFNAPAAPVPSAAPTPDVARAQAQIIADLDAARQARAPEAAKNEARDRYVAAMELEELQATGTALTKDQQMWLAGYQTTAEYRTWTEMVKDFGRQVLAKK